MRWQIDVTGPAEPAAKNRRIEIMVLSKTASDTLYQFFGNHGENVVKPAAKESRIVMFIFSPPSLPSNLQGWAIAFFADDLT